MARSLVNSIADEIFTRNFSETLEEWQELASERGYNVSEDQSCSKFYGDLDGLDADWEDAAINYCQSPIEQMMLAATIFTPCGYGNIPMAIWKTDLPFPPPEKMILISPQFEFLRYKIDLAVFCQAFSGDEIRVAIECDGHDFHKTKEQLKRDRKRERVLQINGWHVLRFTGTEIWKDAELCASDVGDFIFELLERDIQNHKIFDRPIMTLKQKKSGYVSPFTLSQNL
jgi:very-short-patch-repair endonuclease